VRALRTVILAGLATATLVASAGAALADPPTGVTPPAASIVAVGSDTIQYVADQFSTDYNKTSPVNDFYSWDATNPTTGLPGDTISTKADTSNVCSMVRPNGSGAGISTLQGDLKLTSPSPDYCVDLARASRNIQSSDGTGITSVLFAKDLITYAIDSGGNGVTNLTDAELTAIFECNASLIPHTPAYADAPVTWSQVGGTSTAPIVPVLPQSSSGTRSQWLSDIGVSATTLGTCVVNGSFNGTPIEENEGSNAVYTAAGNPTQYKNVLGIFSAGNYVGQVYTKASTNNTGTLQLEDIDSKAPLISSDTINVTGLTAFPAKYIRGLYLVARNAGTATKPLVPTTPINLVPFLGQVNYTGGANTVGWICGATAATDVTHFGFVVPSNCGALTGQ
jgi:ABC-type phosphate transport system substrate-binding protein